MGVQALIPKNARSVDDIGLHGDHVDRGVERLVKACWYAGFVTLASCEGHMDKDKEHFPYVRMIVLNDPNMECVDRMEERLARYNDNNGLEWRLARMELNTPDNFPIFQLFPSCEAADRETLARLQEEADKLAESLFVSERCARLMALPRRA